MERDRDYPFDGARLLEQQNLRAAFRGRSSSFERLNFVGFRLTAMHVGSARAPDGRYGGRLLCYGLW